MDAISRAERPQAASAVADHALSASRFLLLPEKKGCCHSDVADRRVVPLPINASSHSRRRRFTVRKNLPINSPFLAPVRATGRAVSGRDASADFLSDRSASLAQLLRLFPVLMSGRFNESDCFFTDHACASR